MVSFDGGSAVVYLYSCGDVLTVECIQQ